MKRIVKAALLTCVATAASVPTMLYAQAAAAPAAAGQCQMPDAEYQVYNAANTQADPKAKAAALDAYLTQFPNSCAKLTVLLSLPPLYLQSNDRDKAISAADRILQLDPNNFQGLGFEVFLHKAAADAITDQKAKQPELDQAASYAQKGLTAPKPAGASDADFTTAQQGAYPLYYSVIAYASFNKGDFAAAIDEYKKEIAFVSADPKLAPQLQTPSNVLQDLYFMAAAYGQSTPHDYLNCAFYGARVVAFAPDAMKPQFTPYVKYCYKQYHGKDDGFDQLTQLATTNLNPPANLSTTITPAPKPAEIIAGILKSTTPDQLATADKEYILQNGSDDQVQTVWASMKGKSYQFPDLIVIASTPQQVQVAASDDAKANKTADFTFNLTAPEDTAKTPAQKAAQKKKDDAITAAIAPGQTVTLSGTIDSYTPKPFMITVNDGQVILPEAAKPAAGARRPAAAHKPAAH